MPGREPAADPKLAFGRERRAQAEAHARWIRQCRGRAMPALADRSEDCRLPAEVASVLVMLADPCLGRGDAVADRLRTALTAAAVSLRAAAAPLALTADLAMADGQVDCRGILLPYADAHGRVIAVEAIVGVRALADPAHQPEIAAAIEAASYVGAARAASWPARASGGAVASGAAWPVPASPTARLAAARTWVALAATNHARRAASLHAALALAYDLLVAARAGPAARAIVLPDEPAETADPDAALVDGVIGAVFGRALAEDEHATFADIVAHADRLGLGSDGLASLLDRHPGGHAAIAAAERRARDDRPDAPSPQEIRLSLAALDARHLGPLARRDAAGADRERLRAVA